MYWNCVCGITERERDYASKSGSELGLKAVWSAHVQAQYKRETCRTLPQGVKVLKEPMNVSKAHVRGVQDTDMTLTFRRMMAAHSERSEGYKILGHQIH